MTYSIRGLGPDFLTGAFYLSVRGSLSESLVTKLGGPRGAGPGYVFLG